MKNVFCHLELSTGSVPKAKQFYTKLFDWKLEDMAMHDMTYSMLQPGPKQIGGGMQPLRMPKQLPAWMPYVLVDDVKKSVTKARKLGAKIVMDFMPIPGVGSMAVLLDPTGAAIGLWAEEKKAARKPARRK